MEPYSFVTGIGNGPEQNSEFEDRKKSNKYPIVFPDPTVKTFFLTKHTLKTFFWKTIHFEPLLQKGSTCTIHWYGQYCTTQMNTYTKSQKNCITHIKHTHRKTHEIQTQFKITGIHTKIKEIKSTKKSQRTRTNTWTNLKLQKKTDSKTETKIAKKKHQSWNTFQKHWKIP